MQFLTRLRLYAKIAGQSGFLSPVLKMSLIQALILKLIVMMHGTSRIPRSAGTAMLQDPTIYLLDAGILPSGAGTAGLHISTGLISSICQRKDQSYNKNFKDIFSGKSFFFGLLARGPAGNLGRDPMRSGSGSFVFWDLLPRYGCFSGSFLIYL